MTLSGPRRHTTRLGAAALLTAAALSGCAPSKLWETPSDSAPVVTPDSPGTTGTTPGVGVGEPGTTPATTPSSGHSPTPTPTPSPTASQLREVSINFSGDLLWHNTLWDSAAIDGGGTMDFGPQLAGLTDYVSAADLAICHSEVPFAAEGGPYGSYPMFKAPPVIAPALAAVGWDVCTTASNHSLDDGFSGLQRTIEIHEAVGITTSGTYATIEDRNTPVLETTAKGVTVGIVSSTYGTNGIPLPEDKPWAVSLMDIDDILAQAARARAAGADVVVVHMHAGTEYESSPNQQQLDFAAAMTASPDVDLVIGQHAHVVQPITRVNGKWVAYGAGNLIAQSGPAQPLTYDGYLATFTFTEQADGSFAATAAEFVPSMITKHGRGRPARVHIISDALAAGEGDPKALQESAARTRAVVTSLGAEGLAER